MTTFVVSACCYLLLGMFQTVWAAYRGSIRHDEYGMIVLMILFWPIIFSMAILSGLVKYFNRLGERNP